MEVAIIVIFAVCFVGACGWAAYLKFRERRKGGKG